MIWVDTLEAKETLKSLSSLESQVSEINVISNAANAGSGNVNESLRELAYVTEMIRGSVDSLIGSTIEFFDDCVEQMTEKDREIASSFRDTIDNLRGADK